ncbi:GntR family transcriptional regulator [Peribacillus cavernae]|uniref:GntR family transcriptional regulator n=1 Tax=Peribacillus cavernae TaxID=1674310 RepID=A0A3S0TY60_9BACI|nr:GntR family transcriptional regulator [Peribacillus cavernae]MDQ0219537.1 DNA-binding GntR family transcriptional regulator [Peribacillus cavernae]RUQ27053.1 GntR family transcriptional regulator [Peribacillus cavernae]
MREIKKTEPLHSQVYHIVKEMIMEGKYQPGERLVETKVAEKLGVSRGTVREAFRMLTKDDLLVQNDNILLVYNPDAQDILDLYECRKSLETLSAKLASIHISDEQLEQLQLIIEESKEALKINDTKRLTILNQQFHDLIALASQNKQLIQLFEVINAKVLYIRNCILKERLVSFAVLVKDHEQIYLALKERNPAKSEETMSAHIQRSLQVANTSLHEQMAKPEESLS